MEERRPTILTAHIHVCATIQEYFCHFPPTLWHKETTLVHIYHMPREASVVRAGFTI
jgi:hypothetical protein